MMHLKFTKTSHLRYAFLLLFLGLITPNTFLFCQELDHNSLVSQWQEINTYTSVEKQKDSINRLSNALGSLDATTAISLYETLDSLAQNPTLKIEFYLPWSIKERQLDHTEKAVSLRHKGLNMATKANVPYRAYGYLNSLATYHVNRSVADSASYYVKKMEELAMQYPDILGPDYWLAFMRNARVQGILGNTQKEGEMLERAYEEKSKYPSDSNLGFVLYMVNAFYRQQDNPVKGSKYTELLVKHYEKRNINTPDAHFPVESLLLSENTPEAMESLARVIKSSDSLRNYNALSAATLALSRAYLANDTPEKAIPILEKTVATLINEDRLINNSSEIALLQEAYAQTNDYKNAYHSVLRQKAMEDSLRSEQILQNIADYEVKYKTQETQLELEKQQAAKKVLYLLLASGALLLAVIAFFLFRNKKKNILLKAQQNRLQVALSEKEMLLKEIHHRVKNNLQVISSLLSLQQRQLGNDPKANEALQIGRDRVKAMSLIHQNLYQEGNLVGVAVHDYIEKLTQSLVTNYNIQEANINIQNDIAPLKLDVDTIIPLGLIVNELISNALKYAFDVKQQAIIGVSLQQDAQGIALKVTDNGKGLPENFNPTDGTSLGYRLIQAFSNKLKATLDIDSSTNGTTVSLYIPQTFKAA